MRVLGEEAVKDPTAVEARVGKEIADRAHNHEKQNEERKLTKEEKHEKLAKQQAKDAEMGIQCTVYRIENLANPKHRFKVDKNAKDYGLTGLTVVHPKFNIVVVEGGAHSIASYRKLMMQRIDWTENTHPNKEVREGNNSKNKDAEQQASWLKAEDEQGRLKDLSGNRCRVVFEGEEKGRGFRKWGSKVCATDGMAREALGRGKMGDVWALAKSLK